MRNVLALKHHALAKTAVKKLHLVHVPKDARAVGRAVKNNT